MQKIKVQKVKKRVGYMPGTREAVYYDPPLKYCFFNAGDFDFSLDNYTASTRYFNRKGDEIFNSGMAHCKVRYWGSVSVGVIDKTAFDSIPEDYIFELVCFDPRIVTIHVLLTWILCKIEDLSEIDFFSYDDYISLKELTDLLHPIPTMEEAKEFLKKNGIYREEPIYDTFENIYRPMDELLGVPRKIRAYFEK